jgi:peptidoglycan/LPS O-acetylase OafA/YrhL
MQRSNNFDLTRMTLALLVVGQHLRDLTDAPIISRLFASWSGLFAVQAFFVISGFLIVQSYENTGSLKVYLVKRLRRIYPAYVAVVLFCLLSAILTAGSNAFDLLSSSKTWVYFVSNLVFLNFIQDSLPGVFSNNRFSSLNGSLWTIKIEVMFYLLVPLLSHFVKRCSNHLVLGFVFLTSVIYRWYFGSICPNEVLLKQIPGQLMFFCVGAWFYYNAKWFARHGLCIGILGVGLMVLNDFHGNSALRAFGVGFVIMYISLYLKYLGNWSKYGDFSYGVYIVHYPIIQTIVHLGFFRDNPYLGLGLSVLFITLFAFCSWHLIEKRFMLRT